MVAMVPLHCFLCNYVILSLVVCGLTASVGLPLHLIPVDQVFVSLNFGSEKEVLRYSRCHDTAELCCTRPGCCGISAFSYFMPV